MAYGKTYLELVNDVLARLREDPVTTVSANRYSKLIGKFVNETKREVEDAWNWNRLRSTVQILTVPATFNYILTGAGKRFRSIDAFNDSQDLQMRQIPMTALNKYFYYGSVQTSSPIYYGFNGYDIDGDPKVDVWPIPDAIYDLKFNLVIPQAEFTDDADQLIVQEMPVTLGAWAKAISERGEDGGQNSSEAFALYKFALGDAISQDAGLAQDELVWRS